MIAGAGHMVQMEASNEVNQILLDYLQDIQQRQLQ
jgi:pimeloyl-ACP methyl ester carboxylesterase